MITYTVLMAGLAIVLFLARKKVKWGPFVAGAVVAYLMLGTPLGGPLHQAVQSIASAVQVAGNSILAGFGVA